MKTPSMRVLVLAFALFGTPAFAGGTATVASGDGTPVTIEYDGDLVRMDTGNGSYLVVREGRIYLVTSGMVVDASSMMAALSMEAPSPGSEVATLHGIEATGKTETLAGVEGEVVLIDFTNHQGLRQQHEAVLSRDARAQNLQRAWMAMIEALPSAQAEAAGLEAMNKALDGRGILRFGDEMRVTALTGDTPPAERFELPSSPMDFGGMGMGGMGMGGRSRE